MPHIDIKATLMTVAVSLVLLLLMLRNLPVLNNIIPAPTMTLFEQTTGIALGVLLAAFVSLLAGIWVGFTYRSWALKKARRSGLHDN